MGETSKTIAKNTSVLMMSQLITWVLALIMMVFLPRYLAPATVGVFYFSNAVWAIIGMVVTFGTDVLLTKQIARDAQSLPALFSTTIILRILLFILGFAAAFIILRLFNYPLETILIVCIMGLSFLVLQLADVCQSCLRGLERMEYIAIGNVVGKLVSTLAVLVLLIFGRGIYEIAAVFIASALVSFGIQFLFLNRLHALDLRFRPAEAWNLLRAGVPYLMSRISLVIYMQIDIILISLFVNEAAVGWYGTADHLFGSLLFIPTVFLTAVFPVFSRLHLIDMDSLKKLVSKSFDLLLLLSIPIGLGVFITAKPAVVLLFGAEYVHSAPVLAVMGIVLIFTYQNTLIGQFLIAIDRQNVWTIVMAIAAATTILLDILFIPWCQNVFGNGAIGGALAFVVTEVGMMIVGLFLLPRGMLGRANVWTALRIGAAGLIMMVVVTLLQDVFIAISIVVGAVVYTGLILAMQVLPREDIASARHFAHEFRVRFQRTKVEAAIQ